MPLLRRLDAIVARCHRLIERARDPYRPERHYMRGPGPACARRAGSVRATQMASLKH